MYNYACRCTCTSLIIFKQCVDTSIIEFDKHHYTLFISPCYGEKLLEKLFSCKYRADVISQSALQTSCVIINYADNIKRHTNTHTMSNQVGSIHSSLTWFSAGIMAPSKPIMRSCECAPNASHWRAWTLLVLSSSTDNNNNSTCVNTGITRDQHNATIVSCDYNLLRSSKYMYSACVNCTCKLQRKLTTP